MWKAGNCQEATCWNNFLKAWPLENLKNMKLQDYPEFCRWVKTEARELGGINGAHPEHYGVYRYNNVPQGQRLASDNTYAWDSRFGGTAEGAFATIKNYIVQIAEAAHKGDLDAIESIPFGANLVKWKIAFLYQNPNDFKMICIYSLDALRYLAKRPDGTHAECCEKIYSKYCNDPRPFFTLQADLWHDYDAHGRN